MELRHLRYFVAVAEERSFVNAARRVRVAQPAISKQIHDLEGELGVALFHRLPRGVRLTRAGETFLVDARRTLDAAEHAVVSARGAAEGGVSDLAFAHGELAVYTPIIEDLLAAFRAAHPEARVRVSSKSDADTYQALREGQVDVASIFIAEWPVAGFDAMRLVDCTTKGVLLPASHPLAARPSVRLEELRSLTWLQPAPQRWPGFIRTMREALRDRGLVPVRSRSRSSQNAFSLFAAALSDGFANRYPDLDTLGFAICFEIHGVGASQCVRPFEEGPYRPPPLDDRAGQRARTSEYEILAWGNVHDLQWRRDARRLETTSETGRRQLQAVVRQRENGCQPSRS